jgi:Ca2+-binding EF-hand superfamily protein
MMIAAAALLTLTLSARAADAPPAETKPAAAKPAKKAKKPAKASPAHEKFEALDLNHDGVIDHAELEAYEKLVTELKDKDGKAADEKTAAEERAALEAEYKKEDAAHDGKVTEKEFDAADAPAKK